MRCAGDLFKERLMQRQKGACLICGEPLVYLKQAEMMKCSFCGKEEPSYAKCGAGHYVCDACHARQGIESIMRYCAAAAGRDPIAMLTDMMNDPYIHMHGPEHHTMVGAALMTAYRNAGGDIDLTACLAEMKKRGARCPGGSCGFWGCCGAAVSAGMCMSIITGTTPLSGKTWGLANITTARALEAIGRIGGPRCCKRDSFTAVIEEAKLIEAELGIALDMPPRVTCAFSAENKQCLGKNCPYFQGKTE